MRCDDQIPALVNFCFAGVVESRLTHAAGVRSFVCEWVAVGTGLVVCRAWGPRIEAGATFLHECFAWRSGALVTGVYEAGGVGRWSCAVLHD